MKNREKELTALNSSVGADARQSDISTTESIPANLENSNDYSLENIYESFRRLSDPTYLPTVTMSQLYDTVYQSRPPIIDGLLCSGTYLFAGAPKVGKSFFMAQLAYHVSTGTKLWDYEVHQGSVLYLALEDDYQRLQARMSRMFGVTGTDNLYFAVYAKQLGNGLDEQLDRFVREHPETKMIIIDTLQKVREVGGDSYSYANDYQIVGRLKQFADSRGVCMMIVHHTRKTPSGDKFEMISGTTGLLGCADGAFVLQKENRTDRVAVLDIVGRDQPDQRIHLIRDEEKLLWNFDHADNELWKEPPDPLFAALSQFLAGRNAEWSGSASDLIRELNLTVQPNTLSRKLNVRAGTLLNDYNIRYENIHGRSGSQIKLSLAGKPS